MVQRDKIVKDINELLNVALTPEHNGLQVEGKTEIKKIVFGVSATMELFKAAKAAGADMVMTHHGLIWNTAENITGVFGRRVAFLIKNDINLVSYHLPLDRHPVLGNNAGLAKLMGLKNIKPFGVYHGIDIGFMGEVNPARDMESFCALLNGECVICGRNEIRRVAVVSGGAHDMLGQAIDAGVDLFVTGSRDEYVLEQCREAGLNFIAMGHYNSEVFGIKALMEYIKKHYKVETEFIDIPNPF